MRVGILALSMGGVAVASVAHAQERVCSTPIGEWIADLDAVASALRDGDDREAQVQLDLIDQEWECLSAPVPVQPLLRYTQYRTLLAFTDLAPDEALRWARAGEFVQPGGEWPAWVPADHPARSLIEREGPANVVPVPSKYPAHPKKGGIFIDGVFAGTAAGPSYTPILVQVFDGDGEKLAAFWNDGPYLRAPWLSDSARLAAASPPGWWTPDRSVVDDDPLPPPAPVPEPVVTAAPASSAVDCPAEAVTVATIASLSAAATEAFAAADRARFETVGASMPGAIGCLTEVMSATEAGAIHRLHAYRAFVGGDDASALRSFQVALALDASYVLPSAIAPPGGALATLYERGRTSPPVATVPFGTPSGMTAYVDGAAVKRRPISAPALVQLQTADGVYWSRYLTPMDPLPEWLPSAEEALLAAVGEAVIDDFVELRASQAAHQERVVTARAALLAEAEKTFTSTATAARVGDEDGRLALEAYVAKYDNAGVVVDGQSENVVIPQVAAARAWLRTYGVEGAEATVASHAIAVEAARAGTRETASGEWKRTEALIAEADYGGPEAVASFVDRYGDAMVAVGDAEERVFVPEVDVAQDWSAIYGLAAQELPDTHDSLKVVLGLVEEREVLDRDLMLRISDETAALLARASREWAAAMALTDPVEQRTTIETFATRYGSAAIVLKGEWLPVDVPEAALADEWLDAHPPIDTSTELRAWPPARRNVAIVAGGAALAGGALWVTSKVFHDKALGTAADFDQPFAKAEDQAVAANTTAAISIGTFAVAAGLGVVVIAW